MTFNFPGIFPPGRELNVQYDFYDIASATGYVVFDGMNANDSGGNNYILIDSGVSTKMVGLGSATINSVRVTTSSTTSLDIDFDSSIFQIPRTIKGDAYVRVSIADSTGAGAPGSMSVTARIRKWDGSSETEIASAVSPAVNLGAAEETSYTLRMTIASPVTIKKGEQLRLTISTDSEIGGAYDLAHSPEDEAISNFSAGNTRLSVAIPFRIEV